MTIARCHLQWKKKSWIIHFLSTSNVLEKWLNMYEKWIGNCINSTLEIVRIIWAPFIQYSVWVDFITPTGKWNFLRVGKLAIKIALQFFILKWHGNSSGQKWLPGEKWFCHSTLLSEKGQYGTMVVDISTKWSCIFCSYLVKIGV